MKKVYLKNVSKNIRRLEKKYNIINNNISNGIYDITKKSILSKLDKLLFGNINHFIKDKSKENNKTSIDTISNPEYWGKVIYKNIIKNKVFYYSNKTIIKSIMDQIKINNSILKSDNYIYTIVYNSSYNGGMSNVSKYFHTETIIYKNKIKSYDDDKLNLFTDDIRQENIRYKTFSILTGDRCIGFKYNTYKNKYNEFWDVSNVIIIFTNDIDIYSELNNTYIKRFTIHLTNNSSLSQSLCAYNINYINKCSYQDLYKVISPNRIGIIAMLCNDFIGVNINKNMSNILFSLFTEMIQKYICNSYYFYNLYDEMRLSDFIEPICNFNIDIIDNLYELPYYKKIEDIIECMISSDNTLSNFIINGSGGTGKTFYTKNILPKKYDGKITFINIIDDDRELFRDEDEDEDEDDKTLNKYVTSSYTSKLKYLSSKIRNILIDIYHLKTLPICIVWDEFENAMLSTNTANENILIVKEILNKINEIDIPVFFIFLTNDYTRIKDETFYRRGRVDYIIDINNDVNINIDVITGNEIEYFKEWVNKNHKPLDTQYSVNEIEFITKSVGRLKNITLTNKKDILCEYIYEDIIGRGNQ